MPSVMHSIYQYLDLTNTFIYDQLQLPCWDSVVVANTIANTDVFPHPNIEKYPYIKMKDRYYYFDQKIKERVLNLFPPYKFLKSSVVRHFKGIVERYDVKILHAHFGTNGIGLIDLAEKLKIPLVTSFYGYDLNQTMTQEPEIYRELFEKGSLFLVEGPKAKEQLTRRGYPGDKIYPHRLGIRVDKIPFVARVKPRDGVVKFLMVARFIEKKGIPYLVRAMELVNKKLDGKVQLTLVGDGPMKADIMALVEKLQLQSCVRAMGVVPFDQVMKLFVEHHVFVHPSVTASDGDTEGGAPIVLLNAQANGMPVVATKHADIPEEVLDKITGLLVEEKNVEELADAMVYMAQHPESWEKYGLSGRAYVEKKFNAKTQNEELEKLYVSLV